MINPIERALAHERNRLVLLIAGADEDSADSIAESRRRIAALEAELPPEPTPEQQALATKAAEQRQIAANMRAQATADAILETLPTDPTPDDHDAVAEKLERAAQAANSPDHITPENAPKPSDDALNARSDVSATKP